MSHINTTIRSLNTAFVNMPLGICPSRKQYAQARPKSHESVKDKKFLQIFL